MRDKYKKLIEDFDKVLDMDEETYGIGDVFKLLSEELELRIGFEQSKATSDEKILKLDLRKLQFGGGIHTLPGWSNIDIIEPADLVWDVREKLPFPDNCCEEIFSEHMLEHLSYPRANLWVNECFRILKPGGRIVLGVPDAGLAMKAYVNNDKEYFKELKERWYSKRKNMEFYESPIDFVDLVLYDQEGDPKYHRHYWGYDEEKLSKMFLRNGFSKVQKWNFDPNFANPKREWGSIYIEASK